MSQNTKKWKKDEKSNREDDMEGRERQYMINKRGLKTPRPNGPEIIRHIIE